MKVDKKVTIPATITILKKYYSVGLASQYDADPECNICLEKCVMSYKTSCGHYYCASCLMDWLEAEGESCSKTCPNCRQNIAEAVLLLKFEIGMVVPTSETSTMHCKSQLRREVLSQLESVQNQFNTDMCYMQMRCSMPLSMHETIWEDFLRSVGPYGL